ncbi:MAG: hypothetical protein OXF26_00300 [Alphaproteobacteria bacterium]|nr:hypothetical protein [Alphaproteobacteria bacterium]MCY4320272.1 hypothetical protein [Alphaproteobacteria bacterium]
MMIRITVLALILATGSAAAAPQELSGRLVANRPAGCVEYRFLFFGIYRAELWTDAATLPGRNFALSLVYQRGFEREDLVSTSISEMVRMSGRPQASFGVARAELEKAMRTVQEGDRYTAWRSRPGLVEFFHNGRATGTLTQDADLFLDIWLGPASRDPERRAKLLAGGCDD